MKQYILVLFFSLGILLPIPLFSMNATSGSITKQLHYTTPRAKIFTHCLQTSCLKTRCLQKEKYFTKVFFNDDKKDDPFFEYNKKFFKYRIEYFGLQLGTYLSDEFYNAFSEFSKNFNRWEIITELNIQPRTIQNTITLSWQDKSDPNSYYLYKTYQCQITETTQKFSTCFSRSFTFTGLLSDLKDTFTYACAKNPYNVLKLFNKELNELTEKNENMSILYGQSIYNNEKTDCLPVLSFRNVIQHKLYQLLYNIMYHHNNPNRNRKKRPKSKRQSWYKKYFWKTHLEKTIVSLQIKTFLLV